ncbi:Protein of unknown function, partial [Faunimonas pinastri]
MRFLAVALTSLALAAGAPVVANAQTANNDHMKACASQWNEMKAKGTTKGQSYRDFSKSCLSGASQVPAGSTAQCKDGSYIQTATHQGACSRHGGVAKWLDG